MIYDYNKINSKSKTLISTLFCSAGSVITYDQDGNAYTLKKEDQITIIEQVDNKFFPIHIFLFIIT